MSNPPSELETPVSTRRLESFTDGVFAIAATLLVLDLSVASLGAHILTDGMLWHALGSLEPEFLSFGISFLLLGVLWSIHVKQFEFVLHASNGLITLNTVRLLGVVLIPFSTSLNSQYNDLLAGKLFLPLNFLLVTVLGAIQWFYATAPERRLTEGLTPRGRWVSRFTSLTAIFTCLIVVAFAPIFGSWAFLAFCLNPVFDSLGKRLGSRVQQTDAASPTA